MGLNGKLKRKDVDQVNDDFTDFSLSSPATKIRRLDADLPPIREEELEEPLSSTPVTVPNQEKAIVVFNPLLPHQQYHHQNPSNTLSLSLSSDLISRFKDQFLRASEMKCGDFDEKEKESEEEVVEGGGRRRRRRGSCLAVVPWVPSQTLPPLGGLESRDNGGEMMDADGMEVEPVLVNNNTNTSSSSNASARIEQDYYDVGVQQYQHQYWPPPQQQHCMVPQPPPQNPFTPITWSWSQ